MWYSILSGDDGVDVQQRVEPIPSILILGFQVEENECSTTSKKAKNIFLLSKLYFHDKNMNQRFYVSIQLTKETDSFFLH